jgi:hemoglobin
MTTATAAPPTSRVTPYERLGGAEGVHRLVQRFYALMDELPEAYRVRRLHPDDLNGSANSLFEFLSGWFGGPICMYRKKGTRACACATTPTQSARPSAMSGCCA